MTEMLNEVKRSVSNGRKKTKLTLKPCFGYIKAILIKINYRNALYLCLITMPHNSDYIIFGRLTLL